MCSKCGFDACLTRICFISYAVTKTMQLALARGLAETTACTTVIVNSAVFEKTASRVDGQRVVATTWISQRHILG
jgi:hypothetical protein